MKKRFKSKLGLILIMTVLFCLAPFSEKTAITAKADINRPLSDATMVFESGGLDNPFIFSNDKRFTPKSIKGVSFDNATNTLYLNNVDMTYYKLNITGMGDLTINLKGNNKMACIECFAGSATYQSTITFTGNGKLTCNAKKNGKQMNGHISIAGANSNITMQADVQMDLQANSGNSPIQIYRRGEKTGANKAAYYTIVGSHSAGDFKWNSSYIQYEWNKTSFKKYGSGNSSSDNDDDNKNGNNNSSGNGTGKPAKVKSLKGSSTSKGKAQFTWKSLTKNYAGYEARASYYKDYKLASKKTIKKTTKKIIFNSLKSGNTLYFKIRGYNKVNGKKIYGPWVSTKIKIK